MKCGLGDKESSKQHSSNDYSGIFLIECLIYLWDDEQLLIEWGADVMKRNKSSKTAFDLMRHYELKKFLEGKYYI